MPLLTHPSTPLPSPTIAVLPKVLHYGLKIEVPNTPWVFDKHHHYDFDAMMCPPWDLKCVAIGKEGTGGQISSRRGLVGEHPCKGQSDSWIVCHGSDSSKV